MTFAQPGFLWGLVLFPLLWVAYALAHRKWVRRRMVFGDAEVLARMGYFPQFQRAHLKFGMLSLAYLLLLLALARPLGAPTMEKKVVAGADVVVLLDVSDSMQAADVPPSRLQAAYQFLEEWLQQLQGERVGLILFAAEPIVLCPLTIDYGAVRTFLEDARQSVMIKQGTSVGDAIRLALDRFPPHDERQAGRVLLLLSDGEDHGSEPIQAVEEAKQARMPIFVIGIGTLDGGRIPVARSPWGERLYKQYQGKEVISRLDETLLKEIAARSGGVYWRLEDKPLHLLLARLRRLPGQPARSGALQRRREWFPLFAALAALVMLVEGSIAARPLFDQRKAGCLHLHGSAGWRLQEDRLSRGSGQPGGRPA